MDSTKKGAIAEAKVIADLISRGWVVLLPFSPEAFDLVATRNGEWRRVQVKYRAAYRGTLDARARRHVIANGRIESRQNVEIDYVAIYCPKPEAIYYVIACRDVTSLRVVPAKNGQSVGVHHAAEHGAFL